MSAKIRFSTAVVLLLASSAAASERSRLAVLPIEHTGLASGLVPTLTAVLSVELERTGEFQVISTSDIESILDFERQRDLFSCEKTSCLVEVGAALGVDRVLRTHIGNVGSSYVLDMVIINIREGRSEGRAYQGTTARPEALIGLVRDSVAALVAPAGPVSDTNIGLTQPVVTRAASSAANPAAWVTAGAGVVTMVVGGILRHGSGGARRAVGDVTLGVGAAATLAGLVMLGLDRDGGSTTPAVVAATPIPGGAGIVWSGSF